MPYARRLRSVAILLLAPPLVRAQAPTPPDGTPAASNSDLNLTVDSAAASALGLPAAPPGKSDLDFGNGPRKKPKTFEFGSTTSGGRTSVGASAGIGEGKPLEIAVWGGGGAVIGAFAGPVGAVIGGLAGAAVGWVMAVFVVPHNGPEEKKLQ
jgi:hypothetical protein